MFSQLPCSEVRLGYSAPKASSYRKKAVLDMAAGRKISRILTPPDQFYVQTQVVPHQKKTPLMLHCRLEDRDFDTPELWDHLRKRQGLEEAYLGHTHVDFVFTGRGYRITPQGTIPFRGALIDGYRILMPEGDIAKTI